MSAPIAPVVPVVPVVHAVTTDEIVATPDFPAAAAAVMRALGPRGAVHLRAPTLTGRRLLDLTALLAPVQEETGAWLVVNDRLDVALAGGARGVQLTSRSMSSADAALALRRAAPRAPIPSIGASVHTPEEARVAAAEQPPAWLVAGHVFATPSHPGLPERGTSFVRAICDAVDLPVIAIGGVRAADVPLLLADGAHGVAAIRGIWGASDAGVAAAEYLSVHDAVRDARSTDRGGSGAHGADSSGRRDRS